MVAAAIAHLLLLSLLVLLTISSATLNTSLPNIDRTANDNLTPSFISGCDINHSRIIAQLQLFQPHTGCYYCCSFTSSAEKSELSANLTPPSFTPPLIHLLEQIVVISFTCTQQ